MNIQHIGFSYLFLVGSITATSKDDQKDVENTQTDHGDVKSFVFHEISIGKDIVPVDLHRYGDESTRKCRQMSGKALGLIQISQGSNLRSTVSTL